MFRRLARARCPQFERGTALEKTFSQPGLCLDRCDQRSGPDDVDDAGKIVGEHVQRRLDEHPEKMRQRRETVEHPFGTIKARMGATHFLMKTLPRVATEMALHVLTYNLTRVINIMGPGPLIAAIKT